MVTGKNDWEFYLVSAIITFIILFAGIFFGLYIGKEKFKDGSYYSAKRDYTLIQIRYWSYLERLKNECNNTNFITVLYFYSPDCRDCSKPGLIYDYLKQQHPENVMIFALDYDVDLNTLKILKEVYDVKTT